MVRIDTHRVSDKETGSETRPARPPSEPSGAAGWGPRRIQAADKKGLLEGCFCCGWTRAAVAPSLAPPAAAAVAVQAALAA